MEQNENKATKLKCKHCGIDVIYGHYANDGSHGIYCSHECIISENKVTKHTQGKWEVDYNEEGLPRRIKTEDGEHVTYIDGSRYLDPDVKDPEAVANAELIASAPQLKADNDLLSEVLRCIDATIKVKDISSKNTIEAIKIILIGSEAINKTTGSN